MRPRTRLATVGMTLTAALGSVVVSGPVLAAQPAGPPVVQQYPLAGGSTTFLCDGRAIVPTGGVFTSRVRALPGERVLGTLVVHGGTGIDDDGNEYAIRISGRLSGPQDDGSVQLRVVLIGRGQAYRVELLFADAAPPVVTGDCTFVE